MAPKPAPKMKQSTLSFGRPKVVRNVTPDDPALNKEYAKWTKDHFTSTTPAHECKSLHAFLVKQASVRLFTNHHNSKNTALAAWIKSFDLLKEEDDVKEGHKRQTIVSLVAKAAESSKDAPAEDTGEEDSAPVVEGASVRFDVLDERIRAAVTEAEETLHAEETEEDAPVGRKRKREAVQWDRSEFEGPCPYPSLLEYEVSGYFRGQPTSVAEPAVPVAATEDELALVPAGTPSVVADMLRSTPWLQARPDGVYCRCCSVGDNLPLTIFVGSPLPWSEAVHRLRAKSKDHTNTKKRLHETKWKQFLLRQKNSRRFDAQGEVGVMAEGSTTRVASRTRILQTQELIGILHNICYCAKHNLAHTEHVSHLRYRDAAFSGECRKFLATSFNLTSAMVTRELLALMRSLIRNRIMTEIRTSPFVTVLFDEAQDLRKSPQFGVFFRILNNRNHPLEVFWCMQSLDKPATGANVTEHLIQMTDELQIWNRLVGLSCDGCSVNTGKDKGVFTRLVRRKAPFLLLDWCSAHKLNLALLSAVAPPAEENDDTPRGVMVYAAEIVAESHTLFYKGRGSNAGKLRQYREAVAAVAAVVNFGEWKDRELCEGRDRS